MSREATDRLLISGLRVRGHHGVLPHEAELGQVFVLDIELRLDLRRAAEHDDLAATVDYGALVGEVTRLVAGPPRRLIEAVAGDVADLALRDRRVQEVRVRVTKPHAPMPGDGQVAAEVVRGRRAETAGG